MPMAIALLLLSGLLTPQSTPQPAGGDLHTRIAASVDTSTPEWIALHRDLHRHPELSGQEERTARVVAERLEALGLEVRTGVGGHGVVGTLTGGLPGPLVAYRADMDAVRSPAPDSVAFPSTVDGVRHICGHDVHVTIALALASSLAAVRADLPGRVMFIFQPDEERAAGARAMLDAGLFAAEAPVAIFGLHSAPMEVGLVASKAGLMMHASQVAPGVTNHAALFASARADLVRVLGAQAFVDLQEPPPGFSEDFGAFQAEIPGVFLFLGMGPDAMPHSAGFVADEGAIPFGVRAMAAVLVGRLQR